MIEKSDSALTQVQDVPVRKARRSQAERTEDTRRRAMDAAIRCLAKNGYSATTTTKVAEEAGISRGGMLHHFPTKVDLIVAVADEVSKRLHKKRRDELVKIPDGVERFRALTDATWSTSQGDEEMAFIEILMASRGDADLATHLPDLAKRLDEYQFNGTMRMAEEAGIKDQPLVKAMHTLHQAAMRGLALQIVYSGDSAQVEGAVDLLRWYKEQFIKRMLESNSDTP